MGELECLKCIRIFETIGDVFNSPVTTQKKLEQVAEAIVEHLGLKACHFRLLSRDQKILEDIASYGLSQKFLDKGPVDAERSVAEALSGKTVMIQDCSADSRIQYPTEFLQEGIVSLLTVPLRTRGQVIGVMRLMTKEKRAFNEKEIDMIHAVASFSTNAVTYSMFHEILRDVNEAIRSSLELNEVLSSIVKEVCDSLRAKGATIQLLGRKGRLSLKAAYGLSEIYLEKEREEPCAAAFDALRGKCVPILDSLRDPRIPHVAEARQEKLASALFVPMMIRNKSIGVLAVYTHHPFEFADEEMQLITMIADQCAMAVRNAQMYADVKGRYDSLVDEFQVWFEHYHTYGVAGPKPET